MKQYQRSVARFIDYLDEVGISPNGAEEWDDMLVEYKNARSLTKGQLSNTLNGVEFFFPRYKPLRWAKQVADAMAVEADVQHTIPMLPNAANLIASKLALKGYATVGAMLVLQVTTGMRPSDGYRKLKPSHIHIPSDPKKPAVIRLGAKTGTKVKREQFAMIDQHAHADVILMLKRWISVTPPDQFLCDHGYDKVNSLLKETCAELGLGFSYTPHSPRAGFATKGVIDGKTTETIMTEGRWASRGSFIRYLDVVVAAQVQVQLELSQFESDMSLAALNMTSLLSARNLTHHGSRAAASGTILNSRSKGQGAASNQEQTFSTQPIFQSRVHRFRGRGSGESTQQSQLDRTQQGVILQQPAGAQLGSQNEGSQARGEATATQAVRASRAGKGGLRGPTKPRER